jgi:hypothetical protein
MACFTAGVYHPSLRTHVLLPQGHLPSGSQGVTQVAQQYALRVEQSWHLEDRGLPQGQ